MDFINLHIQDYTEAHTSPENPLLQKINRETNANFLYPRMMSGHLQGRLLAMFSQMIKPKYILEIGTYTGYSALSLAEGLQPNGRLITIDINEELENKISSFFEESQYAASIDFLIGDAQVVIPKLEYLFDLVFIDADKDNYLNYYKLVLDKMAKGGYIIADNVLWYGKVIDPPAKVDSETEALREFNDFVQNDSRVENVMLPVRDGLMIMRKK